MAPLSVRITGGVHRSRRLRSTSGADLRPTTEKARAAIFSMVGPETVEGARVLDLYAGTGALAIEAISRGAAWADLVEISARRVRTIRDNLDDLSLARQARVYQARALAALKSLPGGYGLVFADPPYDLEEWEPLMEGLGSRDLLTADSIVVAEHRHGAAMKERYGSLARVKSRRYGDTAVTIYRAGAANG